MHHVADAQQQAPPKGAGRMRAREIVGGEAARFQQGDGQRVAEGQRDRGAGGWRQPERAGFAGNAAVQADVGQAGER